MGKRYLLVLMVLGFAGYLFAMNKKQISSSETCIYSNMFLTKLANEQIGVSEKICNKNSLNTLTIKLYTSNLSNVAEAYALYKEKASSASLEGIYVQDKLRGKGLGSYLFNKIIDLLKSVGIKKVFLNAVSVDGDENQINENIDKLVELYKKMGAQVIKDNRPDILSVSMVYTIKEQVA